MDVVKDEDDDDDEDDNDGLRLVGGGFTTGRIFSIGMSRKNICL
jgi:hypothetical protein